jgi:hypothetical protein
MIPDRHLERPRGQSDKMYLLVLTGRWPVKFAETSKFVSTGVLPMTGLATNFVEYFKGKREAALETLVRITFGTFIGGLVLLLTLLYSGVLLV